MTKALEIHDLAETGQLQLVHRNGDEVRVAPSVNFQNPVGLSDQQEIEWYFREYLDSPFGPAQTRAEAVTTGLANLGREPQCGNLLPQPGATYQLAVLWHGNHL